MLPFAMFVMAVAGVFLPAPWARPVTAAQAVFYGLAAADPWLPKNSVWKRLASLSRTFFVLMAASVAAVGIFFMPARRLWKAATTRRRVTLFPGWRRDNLRVLLIQPYVPSLPATVPLQILGTGEGSGSGSIREIRGTRVLVVCEPAPAAGALLRMDLAGAVALGEVVLCG
jgi:hypothetical protein